MGLLQGITERQGEKKFAAYARYVDDLARESTHGCVNDVVSKILAVVPLGADMSVMSR